MQKRRMNGLIFNSVNLDDFKSKQNCIFFQKLHFYVGGTCGRQTTIDTGLWLCFMWLCNKSISDHIMTKMHRHFRNTILKHYTSHASSRTQFM